MHLRTIARQRSGVVVGKAVTRGGDAVGQKGWKSEHHESGGRKIKRRAFHRNQNWARDESRVAIRCAIARKKLCNYNATQTGMLSTLDMGQALVEVDEARRSSRGALRVTCVKDQSSFALQ